MSYKGEKNNYKFNKQRENEDDIENNDQELLNLNDIEDRDAHQSGLNDEDEDAYSDHDNTNN